MKKTVAVASLALSTSLILAACGSDSEETPSSSPTTSEEVDGTDVVDAADVDPLAVDPDSLPDRTTPVDAEADGVVAPETAEDGAVKVSLADNTVQVNYAPWFLTCSDDPSATTLEELFSPDQSKFDTLVFEYDEAYLEIPTASAASDASELPGAVDVDDLEDTPSTVGDVAPKTSIVLNDLGGLESVGSQVWEPLAAGTTELRVAYSCPTSGEVFDESWTLEIA